MNIAIMTTDQLIESVSKMMQNPFEIERLCWQMTKHYRERSSEQTDFEKGWYESVERGEPDFSIYNGERYVPEATACYLVYAKRYIRTAAKFIEDKWDISEIWDLGCGIGASTALLKLLFPSAKVYGTQVISDQRRIAETFSIPNGFSITDSMQAQKGAVVFMLDYLEHFESPTEHIKSIILQEPKLLIMANSFGATAVGHFPEYVIEGKKYKNKETGRAFGKWLKNNGYKKVNTGFYNNRPAIWEKSQ